METGKKLPLVHLIQGRRTQVLVYGCLTEICLLFQIFLKNFYKILRKIHVIWLGDMLALLIIYKFSLKNFNESSQGLYNHYALMKRRITWIVMAGAIL